MILSVLSFLPFAFSSNEIVGFVGVPGFAGNVNLATQVGQPLNRGLIQQDVRRLWSTGRFEDIRVKTAERAGGTSILFEVVPASDMRLHQLRIEPSSYGIRLSVLEGTTINRLRAHEIAAEGRRQLTAQGYRDAQVDYEMVPYSKGSVDLRLTVKAVDPVRVKYVQFSGAGDLDPKSALHALRPRRLLFWRLLPAYSPQAVDSDLAKVLSLYLSKGYFDASVRWRDTDFNGNDASVRIDVQPGPHYRAPEQASLCSEFLAERREAERAGILDFSARVSVKTTGEAAHLESATERGPAYRVGRINFSGNRHFSDATIRRAFVLEEAQPLDEFLLRKSLDRLNQANLFERVDAGNVVIVPNESTGLADVNIPLKEPKRGKWSLSGPVGPTSIGGALTASVSSRLPPWGSKMFELSTYTASISFLAFAHPIIPVAGAVRNGIVLALDRPFSPAAGWASGFMIAPRLGWQASAISYGTAQIRGRLLPKLAGDRDPILPVTLETSTGEKTMFCEPPLPRLSALRKTAALGLQFMGALPVF